MLGRRMEVQLRVMLCISQAVLSLANRSASCAAIRAYLTFSLFVITDVKLSHVVSVWTYARAVQFLI